MTSWSFDSEAETGTWESVKSPVSVTLRAVTSTTNGPCAVGDKGYVLGRSEKEGWGIVIENGPAAAENSLYTVDTTEGGKRVWFAGGNGALGFYDLEKHERRDFSEPQGMDATISSLTVAGKRGSEKLMIADDSGNVLPGEMKSDGVTMDWSTLSQPAGDSALNALCSTDRGVGYGVDSNANVWQTTADEGWERVGIDDASNSFYAASAEGGRILVGGGNGRVYLTPDLKVWTPYNVGNFTVEALDVDSDEMVAAGGSGNIVYRKGESDWKNVEWSESKTILGVMLGQPSVGVGKGGTIVEQKPDDGDSWGGPQNPDDEPDSTSSTSGDSTSSSSDSTSTQEENYDEDHSS